MLEESNALKNVSERSQSQHILDDEEFNENDDNEFDDEYLWTNYNSIFISIIINTFFIFNYNNHYYKNY